MRETPFFAFRGPLRNFQSRIRSNLFNFLLQKFIVVMEKLSAELKQHLFEFLDVSSLLTLADTSKSLRNEVTDHHFLEKYCRRKFDLSIDELPPLTTSEKLLIDTQRLNFQAISPIFPDGCEPLMKVYAMEMRASWYPCAFVEECVGENVALRQLKYPWPYDSGAEFGEETTFYKEAKKFSARIHAACPRLFDILARYTAAEPSRLELSYYKDEYPDELLHGTSQAVEDWMGLDDRMPRVINIEFEEKRLVFFIYEDTNAWRALSYAVINGPGYFMSDTDIAMDASLADIRHEIGDVIQYFGSTATTTSAGCPPYLMLASTRLDFHNFQLELHQVLSSGICTGAYHMGKTISGISANEDLGRRRPTSRKVIEFVDNLYPCADIDHEDCAKKRKKPSQTVNIALNRALRRMINDSYIAEIQRYFEDTVTFQMVHSWSFMAKGRKNHLVCFDSARPAKFDRNRCFMKVAIDSLCCHRANPEIWPAITLKKAIDQLPRFMQSLEEDVTRFVSRCVDR